MKYSLANKDFKKRNNIFGERKHHQVIDEYAQQSLGCVQQLGQDLEDSHLQFDNIDDRKRESIYQYIDFGYSKPQKNKQTPIIESSLHNNREGKPGRHGLSPNIKPSHPIMRTAPPISTISTKIKPILKRSLRLDSSVVEFSYFSDEAQIKFAQIKQVILKLFMILQKNNQKIALLQTLLHLATSRDYKMMREIHFCLANSLGIESKVDLFLNTMRNVYQNLRITKLKQQNIELYIKQNSYKPQSPIKLNNILQTSKIQPGNSHHQSYKEAEQLMSLLQYQSESSFVEPYLLKQKEQISKQALRSADKYNYIQNEPTVEINRKISKVRQASNAQQTLKDDLKNFQRLSPFQANHFISNLALKHQSFKETPKVKDSFKKSQIRHKEQSPKSNWSYSFEMNEFDKIRSWCKKRGEQNMACWLDDLGCLRRPNMTYIFWPNGEVMRVSQNVFLQLEEEGLIQNCKRLS